MNILNALRAAAFGAASALFAAPALAQSLYVSNLSLNLDDATLKTIFEVHGAVSSVKIITNKETGHSKGYAYVEMMNVQDAEAAIAALNGKVHADNGGRTLNVSIAPARPDQTPTRDGQRSARRNRF